MIDYHINIFASAEDGGSIADIPVLACYSAFGFTPEPALAEVQIANVAQLETARLSGEPKYRPTTDQWRYESHGITACRDRRR